MTYPSLDRAVRPVVALLICFNVLFSASPKLQATSATLDNSFAVGIGAGFPSDPQGFYWPQVQAVAVQADGKVIAGGQALFTNFNGTPIRALCRINVDGSLDTTFMSNLGTGTATSNGGPGEINSIAIQPDGKILIGGDFASVNGLSRSCVARLNADGSVDTGFMAAGGGVGGAVFRYVRRVVLQNDGKILISGGFSSFAGSSRPNIARLNSDGTHDTSFAPGFPFSTTVAINAVGIRSDGKIYVGGTFTNWFGLTTPGLARLESNGALDASFQPLHSIPFPSVNCLSVLADGRMLVGGFLEGTATNTTRFFARFNNDGSIDQSYPASGLTQGLVMDIQPWPEGGHLISGRFRGVGGVPRGEMALLDANGNLDLGFEIPVVPEATNDLTHIYSMAVAPDGKIVFGGWFTNFPAQSTKLNGQDYSGIGRLLGGFVGGPGKIQFTSAQTLVDESAGTATVFVSRFGGTTGAVSVNFATSVGTAGAGDFTTTNGTLSWTAGEAGTKSFTIAINSDASAEGLESINVTLSSPTGGAVLGALSSSVVTIIDDDSAPTIATQPQDQSIILTFNATFRVSVGPGLAATYQWLSNSVPILNATNAFLALNNVQSSFAGGYSVIVSNTIGSVTSSVATLTIVVPAGLPAPEFVTPGVGFNQDVYDALFQTNGQLIVVGGFNQYGGVTIPASIARLNLDGSRDATFPAGGVGANSLVQAIAQFPDGKFIIAGGFNQYGGTSRSKIARLNFDGSLDTSYSNLTLSATTIYAVLPQNDGSLLVGDTSLVRRFLPSGAVDTNFTLTTLSGQVYGIAQQVDGKILATPYRTSSSQNGTEVIRLNPNGTRDLSFASIGRLNGTIQNIKMLPDGRILVAGGFTTRIVDDATNSVSRILVLTKDGEIDPSFDVGSGPESSIIDVFIQADGRILIGGGFNTWNGVNIGDNMVRLLPNGELDPTFITGAGANNFVRAITMDPAGRIGIGGTFTLVNGQSRGRVALITHDGGAIQLASNTLRVNEQDGTISVSVERVAGSRGIASVNYATISGTATPGSDYTTVNGQLTWNDGEFGMKTFNIALNNDAAVESDETLDVVLSNFTDAVPGIFTNLSIEILDNESAPRIATQPESVVAAEELNVTFSVSAYSALPISYQWRSNSVNIANATNAALTLSNVSSNSAATYSVVVSNSVGSTVSSNAVLTIIPSPTRRDTTFVASPALNGAVRAIYPLGDGRVMVGGDFTQPRNRIALFNANGTLDGTFTNTATSTGGFTSVYDIERDRQGRWLIVGSFHQFGGAVVTNLVRLNADYTVDTNFLAALGRGPNDLVSEVAVGPDGKIWIAGAFTSVGGPHGLRKLARLNENGSIDLTFSQRGNNNAAYSRVIPLPDGGALVGGSFNNYDGVVAQNLRKIFADGSLDTSFTPTVSDNVIDMIQLPDGSLIVSGNFNSPSPRIIKIKPNGGLESSFLQGVSANNPVNSLAAQSNGRIVAVGSFTSLGIHTNRFTRVNADGTQDSSLSLGSGFSGDAHRVALEHTGEIWVGGAFTQYKGSGPGYLVRLVGDVPVITIGHQPLDRVMAPGQNATFSVTAAGTGSLTYQWLKNGSLIFNGGVVSGANTATLSLTGSTVGDAGLYSVIVSNSAGASVTSRAASLVVQGIPVIVTQPSSNFVPVGGKIVLNVVAQGVPTLGYQWFEDGAPVGGNSPNYTLNNAPLSAGGNYRVVVSNSFGAVTSDVAVVTVAATPATAAPGFFTDAGIVNTFDTIFSLQPMPDGKLLAGGTFSQVRSNGANLTFRQSIALFDTNGTVAGFNPSADSQINKVLRQRDGKILVAGNFNNIAGNPRRFIARFNVDLTFDTNFHNALYTSFSINGPDASVSDVALQADGKILIVGGFTSVNGAANTRGVARLNTDGSVDDSFVSGVPNFGNCSAVEVLPDGRIVLFCSGSYGGHNSSAFRVMPNGTVDTSFTVSTDGALVSLAVQTNGAVLIGGTFSTVNSSPNPLIVRIGTNGQVDTNFVTGISKATAHNQAVIRSIAVQDNGKILAGGNFLTFGPFRNGLARLNANGSPDETFIFQEAIGDDYNADIFEIALFANGRIAIGGRFATWEGTAENGLAILNGDPVPLAFASQPIDQFVVAGTNVQFSAKVIGNFVDYQWFRGATPLADGGNVSGAKSDTLTLSGVSLADAAFYSLQISNASGTRFSLPAELFLLGAPVFREQPNGGIHFRSNSLSLRASVLGVTPIAYQWFWNSNVVASATNNSLSLTNLALTNSGDYQLVASNIFGVVTSAVATVTVLNPPASMSGTWPHPAGANNGLYAVAPLGDGRVMIGGQFTFAGPTGNDTARANLALLNTNGTVDATFNPAPDNRVQVIRRDSSGRFLVGGWFNNIGGQSRNYFARLNSDGSLDTNFLGNLGSGPNQFVNDIAVQPNGKILVGGSFAIVSGQSYANIVRLNDNGTIDTSFRLNMPFAQQIQTVAALNDGKIYVGGFLTVSNRQNLIRLESNGAVDLSFNVTVNSSVNRIIPVADGVIIGGGFSIVNSTSAAYLAKLNLAGELDSAWPQVRPNQTVNDILRQANGKIIAVGSFNTAGVSRNQIARYNADGSLDTTFVPVNGFGFQTPRTLAVESDGRIWVGGSFSTYENIQVRNLVLITGDPVVPGSGSPFENWAESFGLIPGNDGPGDDADNDGVANVFEYYFGTSPADAGSSETTFGGSVKVGGATYPAITFVRVKNIESVTLLSEASSNVNFSDSLGTIVESVVDIGDELEEVTIRSSVSDTVQPTQFMRIQLSVP